MLHLPRHFSPLFLSHPPATVTHMTTTQTTTTSFDHHFPIPYLDEFATFEQWCLAVVGECLDSSRWWLHEADAVLHKVVFNAEGGLDYLEASSGTAAESLGFRTGRLTDPQGNTVTKVTPHHFREAISHLLNETDGRLTDDGRAFLKTITDSLTRGGEDFEFSPYAAAVLDRAITQAAH